MAIYTIAMYQYQFTRAYNYSYLSPYVLYS